MPRYLLSIGRAGHVSRNYILNATDRAMGQASSVQREPSMEEILASIRKIIEDSDTVRLPVAETALPDVVKVVGGSNAKSDAGDSLAPTYNAPDTHVSLVDEYQEPASLLAADDQNFEAFDASEMTQPDLESQIEEVGLAKFETVADEAPIAASEMQVQQEANVAAEVTDFHSESEDDHNVITALVSDSSAKRVNTAFGELSQAYAASRERSLDAMAKEMLQPMLKEWLDSNLPALVEKLVREEIQRITNDMQN